MRKETNKQMKGSASSASQPDRKNDKDDKKLTEEDLKRGFKITNLKYLKNFEPPDAFPDDIQERIKSAKIEL